MLLNEIEINGIYVASLDVQYRTNEEVIKTKFLVKVIDSVHTQGNDVVEFVFLNSPDNSVHYAYTKQINPVN